MRRKPAPAFVLAAVILWGAFSASGGPAGALGADPPKSPPLPAAVGNPKSGVADKQDNKKDDPKAAAPAPASAKSAEAKPSDPKAADAKPPVKKDDAKKDDAKKDDAKKDDAKKDDKPTESKFTTKAVPESIDELKALEAQVEKVVQQTRSATVGVRVGSSMGSGIIVTKDGYVLTAGHVVGEPDRDVEFIFSDGKKAKGKTLGLNHEVDSGLMKITDPGEWPFVEMGKSGDMKLGEWVVVTGHPGGYRVGRPPVVRLGRLIQNRNGTIWTDAPLVGGDSGGPTFNLDGKVVAINDRIDWPLTMNYHVPVDTYRDTWDRLAKSEEWGPGSNRNAAWLGITVGAHEKGCKLTEVTSNSPAAKAELKVDDVVTKFDGSAVKDFEALKGFLQKKKPGNEIKLEVLRGDETFEKKITLAKRPA